MQGRFDEALAEVKYALNTDPLSLYMNAALVMTYYFTRRFDEAVAHGRTAVELDPSFYPMHFYLGLAYQQTGRFAEAGAELQQARRHSAGAPAQLDTARFERQATLDRGEDLVHANVEQAHGLQPTTTKEMTLALLGSRNRDVLRPPWTVPNGTSRSKQRNHRRPDCGGKVHRTGVARHDERRITRERDQVCDRRSPWHERGSLREPRDLLGEPALIIVTPERDRPETMTISQRGRHRPEPRDDRKH
jgi:hypothetical protein